MFGKLLALPMRILNVPARAIEKTVAFMEGEDDMPKNERVLSTPLESIAETLEEAVDG